MSFLISVVAFTVVLGIMIVAHEFGHFAVAKLCGVRVEVFSIGFGKRLFGFRRGDTDYRVAILPLGGYVKMAGENPMEERQGDPGEFLSKPRWQRFLVAVAGPAMNVLLAIVIMTGVYMVHFETAAFLTGPAVVGWVRQDSSAAKAGIQPGDRIVRIDGVDQPTWDDIFLHVVISPGQSLPVTLERGQQTLRTSVTPESVGVERMGGNVGWAADRPILVDSVDPEMPGAKAGLQAGDEIASLNGTRMCCVEQLLDYLAQNKDKPVRVGILREGKPLELTATPVLNTVNGDTRYRLGFQPGDRMIVEKLPFLTAFGQSLEVNKSFSFLFIEVVKKVVERKVSVKQFEGPIGIGRAVGAAAQQPGWLPLLSLTAAISLQLGILNLLPIPILDGGMILLLLIEGAIRRDISMRIKERIYQVAFVFLVMFVGLVIYNDLVKAVPGLAKYLP
jgi:regulator of sigma E protease